MIGRMISVGVIAASLALSTFAYGEKRSASEGSGRAENVAWPQEWEAMVNAARREGQVEVILSGQVPAKLSKVLPAFEEKYGVKVNFQTGGGRQHVDRILAERRLGRYTVDAWIGGAASVLARLAPLNALQPLPPLLLHPEVKDPSRWYQGRHHYVDPDQYVFVWGASPVHTISYNTDLVKPEEIKSYWDLLDPKWKGKIVSWSPDVGSSSTVVPMYMDNKIGDEWFRRWANEMDVTIVSDARQGAEWVAMGRFPIGLFGLNTQADALDKQGFPIKGYLPHPMQEGEILSASAANVLAFADGPHPNATKLFVNWVLSKEAQTAFIKVSQRTDSLRLDVSNDSIPAHQRIRRDVDYQAPFSDPDYAATQQVVIDKLRNIMREAGYR